MNLHTTTLDRPLDRSEERKHLPQFLKDKIDTYEKSQHKGTKYLNEKTDVQRMEEQEQAFYKIFSAMMTKQVPGEEGINMGDITGTYMQMQNAKNSLESVGIQKEIKNALSRDDLEKYSHYVDQHVAYETNKGFFDGQNTTEFQYRIDLDKMKLPLDTPVFNEIVIFDEHKKEIFRDRRYGVNGKNIFLWDGNTNDHDVKAPMGEYYIKIDSHASIIADGQTIEIPISAETKEDGIVGSIDVDESGTFATINSKKIPVHNIVDIIGHEAAIAELRNISDYAPYIGKSGKIKIDQATVKNGKVDINFIADITSPGKCIIKLFKDDIISSVFIKDKVRFGTNNIAYEAKNAITEKQYSAFQNNEITLSNISDGKYRAEIYLEDLQSPNEQYTKLPEYLDVRIDTLDFSDGKHFVYNGIKYNIDDLYEIGGTDYNADMAMNEGLHYINKKVQLAYDTIRFGGKDITIPFGLDATDDESVYSNVRMEIYSEDNRFIKEIQKNTAIFDDSMINNHMGLGKQYLEKFFTAVEVKHDKTQSTADDNIDDNNINNSTNTELDDHQDDDNSHKTYILKDFDGLIKELYPNVKFSQNELEELKITYSNFDPVNHLTWDGTDASGNKAMFGNYKFKIFADKLQNDGTKEITEIVNNIDVIITDFEINHGEIDLYGYTTKFNENNHQYEIMGDRLFVPKASIKTVAAP